MRTGDIVRTFYSLQQIVRLVQPDYTNPIRDLENNGLSGTMHGNPVGIDIFGVWWLIEKFDAGMSFGFYDRASNKCGHGLQIGGHIVNPIALHCSQVNDTVWPVYSLREVISGLGVKYHFHHCQGLLSSLIL